LYGVTLIKARRFKKFIIGENEVSFIIRVIHTLISNIKLCKFRYIYLYIGKETNASIVVLAK